MAMNYIRNKNKSQILNGIKFCDETNRTRNTRKKFMMCEKKIFECVRCIYDLNIIRNHVQGI